FVPDPAASSLHTLSLHDALPISSQCRPPIHRCARELGAIVADDGIDLSSFGDEPVEYARYPSSGQREIHLDGQALSGEIVDEGQDSEATSICQGIRHEVHRPALDRTAWWQWNASKRGRDSLPLLPTDDEVLLAVQAIDPLVVYPVASPPKQSMEPSVPEPRTLGRNLAK